MADEEPLQQLHSEVVHVNIRKTHPNLYRSVTLFAVLYIALALNFFFAHPTFRPLNISYVLIGAIFMALGVTKLVFLNVTRHLRVVRAVMACEISFMCFWALANTQQFWAHKSSLQLPIAYLALSLLELPLLIEPAINPVTEKPQ